MLKYSKLYTYFLLSHESSSVLEKQVARVSPLVNTNINSLLSTSVKHMFDEDDSTALEKLPGIAIYKGMQCFT